jgi:hypothetical protein
MNEQDTNTKPESIAEKMKRMGFACGCGCAGCDMGASAGDEQKDQDAE